MTIRRGGSIIAGCVASGANPDNKSITTNSSDQIQSIGVINQNNTTSAIKTWTGTKTQYDALVSGGTVDSNTLYNITDDTDITLTILDTLYPIGSIYITTADSCPLSILISGSVWVKEANKILTGLSVSAPCRGDGKTLGITDGTNLAGLNSGSVGANGLYLNTNQSLYGTDVGSTYTADQRLQGSKSVGITTDETKSGIVADLTTVQQTYLVNIFRRTL